MPGYRGMMREVVEALDLAPLCSPLYGGGRGVSRAHNLFSLSPLSRLSLSPLSQTRTQTPTPLTPNSHIPGADAGVPRHDAGGGGSREQGTPRPDLRCFENPMAQTFDDISKVQEAVTSSRTSETMRTASISRWTGSKTTMN